MGKKKEIEHVDENLINDDISDDILLNEDLDDPLLDEMDAILHGKEYKPKLKPEPKQKSDKNTKNQTSSKPNIPNLPKYTKITKQILKEFLRLEILQMPLMDLDKLSQLLPKAR